MSELKDLRPSSVRGISAQHLASALGATIRRADSDPLITGVTLDSADVQPGDLFVAIPGFKRHGAEFAPKAIAGVSSQLSQTLQGFLCSRAQRVLHCWR